MLTAFFQNIRIFVEFEQPIQNCPTFGTGKVREFFRRFGSTHIQWAYQQILRTIPTVMLPVVATVIES